MIEHIESDKSGNQTDSQDEGLSQKSECRRSTEEKLVKINVPLPNLNHQQIDTGVTQLLILADTSGSMSGNPITQVKSALKDILDGALDQPSMVTNLILFNNEACTVNLDRTNYLSQVEKIKSGGGTNFSAAFEHVGNEMRKVRKKTDKKIEKTVIVFLTDGVDARLYGTKTVEQKWFQSLMASVENSAGRSSITIHAVGFSKEHHYEFLKKLTEQGTGEGMFRYCEPGDGPTVLRDKLQELFDFVLSNATSSMNVMVSIPGTNQILEGGTAKHSAIYSGEITKDEESGKSELGVDFWMLVSDPDSTNLSVAVEMTIMNKQGKPEKTFVPCEVTSTQRQIVRAEEKVVWNLKVLQRNSDVLLADIGKAICEKNVKENLSNRVDKLEDRLSQVPLFRKEFDKELREILKGHLDDIKKKIDQMRNVLAEYARGNTQSVQMLARAHDMRYQAKFSKSRRQRILDKRVAKNMPHLQSAQAQLDQIQLDREEIQRMSRSSTDFFVCTLSLNNIKDILLDSDKDDAIGFGLAVRRQEHVLDAPTLVELHSVSGTLVSRCAMLDALEYKINCEGQLRAHGGFDFSQPLGVTTIGQSREPINAWLPLYCTKQHWERVKVLLKPSLGYFCTLDPLGYDFQQMDVMFMILGSMVGELSDTKSNDQQLKMIFCFLRTCQACVQEFSLENKLTEAVRLFLTSPEDRFKHKLPNLYTMIGYVLSLPANTITQILDGEENLRKFWLAMVTECLRRAASRNLREINSNISHGLIDLILHGKKEKDLLEKSPALTELLKLMLTESNNKDLPLTKVFDPREGLTIDDSRTKKYDEKLDQALEVWAQAELDIIRNKNQASKVNAARKAVEKWQHEGREGVVVDPTAETESGVDDPCSLTQSKLQHLAMMLQIFSNQAKPTVQSFLGCMAFIKMWLGQSLDIDEMDKNDGLPPEKWIVMAKEAVKRVYSCANDQLKRFLNTDKDKEEDTLVVQGSVNDKVSLVSNSEETQTAGCNQSKDKSQGQNVNEDNDDVDDDDNDGESSDESDDLNEDMDDYYIASKPRKIVKDVKKHISLPVILTLIDPDLDVMQLTRLLMCQIILCHSNSKARAAVSSKQYIDFALTVDYKEELRKLDLLLIKMREEAIKDVMESVQNMRANYCMLHTPSVWAFIGYLMCTYKERGQGFSDLVSTIVDDNCQETYPLLSEKVRVMFLGKYNDHAVLAKGNVWIPDAKLSKKFATVLGEEVWNDIEISVRSCVQLHVYRESDIPNRHGHCNSNPYIPNELRKKLGMPLL